MGRNWNDFDLATTIWPVA